MSIAPHITIATRESRLALWQAEHVKNLLSKLYPEAQIDLLGMTTRGDQILDRSLAAIGGKGLFIKELEVAMQEGRAQLAVHSMKDVPMNLAPEFELCIAGNREDPHDAFVSNQFQRLEDLPAGAVVGTSSLRRACQIRARFPHLRVDSLRGNLDTRLRKLDQNEYSAILLACAGLRRLGLEQRIRSLLPLEQSLPAVGQGALGLEFNSAHPHMTEWLAPLRNHRTEICILAERALARRLEGSCEVPLGAHASFDGADLTLSAFVGRPDGSLLLHAHSSGPMTKPEQLGLEVAELLLAQGAQQILEACRSYPESAPLIGGKSQ